VKFRKIFDFKLPKSKRRTRRDEQRRREKISENVPASIKASSQTLNHARPNKRRGLIQRKVTLPKRTGAQQQSAPSRAQQEEYQVKPLNY
ncbi:MAG: hypothetical protein AAGF06_06750, partial [Pseudomonadota bacterium]